jgi:predicted Zn-dependent peptidase
MKDLDAASLDDVKAFFRTWYAPANATLAVVGDFDVEKTKALIEKYFGTLPSGPKPQTPQVQPVKLTQEVEIRHDEQVATLPLVYLAWHSPAFYKEGDATADVLATVLSDGKASRLYRRLVYEKQLAQSVSASQQSLGSQSVFAIQAVARPGVSTDTLKKEIDQVLQEVRSEGVTKEEIQRARDRYETRTLAGLQSIGGFGGKADTLQNYNHFLGQPDYLAQDLARYDTVTSASVKAFASDVLAPNARVVVHAVPPSSAPAVSKEKK